MPKTNTKPGTWLHDLRRQIKRQYGPGWSVIEQSSKVKLTRRNEGSVMLDIPWLARSTTAILNEIGVIRSRMLERDIGLREAHSLGAAVEALVTGRGVVVDSLNWDQIAQDFLDSRSDNRKNTTRPTSVRIQKALTTLQSKPKPTDGGSLMRAYAKAHFGRCPAGGVGRRRHLGDLAAFLRFAVERHGAPRFWMPITGEALEELIGATDRPVGDELTPPVKPDQLARLLDAIEASGDQSIWMAVALVGCFGLRPSELAVLDVRDGELFVGGGVKRNPQSKKRSQPPKPRLAIALEIPGRNDGQRAIEMLTSGVPFPRQLATQVEKAHAGEDVLKAVGNKLAKYVNQIPCWQELVAETPGLTPYSLRHGYAWRAHKVYERPIAIRDAAALMGHSAMTHQRHYGQWVDDAGLRDAVKRATGS